MTMTMMTTIIEVPDTFVPDHPRKYECGCDLNCVTGTPSTRLYEMGGS